MGLDTNSVWDVSGLRESGRECQETVGFLPGALGEDGTEARGLEGIICNPLAVSSAHSADTSKVNKPTSW